MRYFSSSIFIFLLFVLAAFSNEEPQKDDLPFRLKAKKTKKGIQLFQAKEDLINSEKLNQLNVDLRNPHYQSGELSTTEGGVIQNLDMRIQAREIRYIRKTESGKPIHKIIAKGDLILQYKAKVYTGDELEYDLSTRSGIIHNGRTFANPWYFNGSEICVERDGSFFIHDASITTCENQESTWDLHAQEVHVQKKDYLKAKNVGFRFFKVPTFWLPTFKMNLKKFFSTPIIRYKASLDSKYRPRISMRYQLYSWKDFACYLRGDYRFSTGLGGALETEYYPSHKRTTFETKNYVGTDILQNDPHKKRRFRLQGAYHTYSMTKKTHIDAVWDKYSDIDMPGDFKSDDFEINTAKRTEASIHHREDDLIARLYTRPKVNSFASIKQDLPSAYVTMRPFDINPSGIISYNWTKSAYVDYSYSDHLRPNLKDFHSARLETHHELYRPFHNEGYCITPFVGVAGIYYNNNPCDKKPVGLGAIKYGIDSRTYLHKQYRSTKHIVAPYVQFKGWTNPTAEIDEHYIFSLADGYNKINEVKAGIHNFLFSTKSLQLPQLETDLYANAFIGDRKRKLLFPKAYLNAAINLANFRLTSLNGWNILHKRLDFSNFRVGWTANEDFAASVEFRHRSKYDWRKIDHENYILDVSRPEFELLRSPLSDRRNTFLANIFVRLTPLWTCHLQSHTGWDRWGEGHYNELRADLMTYISSSWKLKVTCQLNQRGVRFSGSVDLVK